MSKNVLVNLNMNGNEIQNVVMQNLATAPSSPKLGQFYYNSTDKKAYQWNGSAWKPFGSEITVDSALSSSSTNPVQNKVINTALSGKVDAVSGKGLSTNDYTTAEKTKLSGIAEGANKTVVDSALSSSSTNPVQNKVVNTALAGKVDAVSGKGLSTNDYTTAEKTKLSGIAEGANKTVVDSSLSSTSTNPVQNKVVSAALDEKLNSSETATSISAQNRTSVPRSGAVIDYVSDAISRGIAASDAMIFKGTIGTGGTVTSLPTTYQTGWTYRVITAGTYAGNVCEVGDLIIALVDRSGSSNANSDWTVAQTNIDGAITSISGTSPVSVSGSGSSRSISHANSGVSAGTYGNTSAQSPAFGDTANIPYVTTNATGHVTGAGTATVKIPNTEATTSAAGLMSATDKIILNRFGDLEVGMTRISLANSTPGTYVLSDGKALLGYTAFQGELTGPMEEVLVDVEYKSNEFYFSVAEYPSSPIYIFYVKGGTYMQ